MFRTRAVAQVAGSGADRADGDCVHWRMSSLIKSCRRGRSLPPRPRSAAVLVAAPAAVVRGHQVSPPRRPALRSRWGSRQQTATSDASRAPAALRLQTGHRSKTVGPRSPRTRGGSTWIQPRGRPHLVRASPALVAAGAAASPSATSPPRSVAAPQTLLGDPTPRAVQRPRSSASGRSVAPSRASRPTGGCHQFSCAPVRIGAGRAVRHLTATDDHRAGRGAGDSRRCSARGEPTKPSLAC